MTDSWFTFFFLRHALCSVCCLIAEFERRLNEAVVPYLKVLSLLGMINFRSLN